MADCVIITGSQIKSMGFRTKCEYVPAPHEREILTQPQERTMGPPSFENAARYHEGRAIREDEMGGYPNLKHRDPCGKSMFWDYSTHAGRKAEAW